MNILNLKKKALAWKKTDTNNTVERRNGDIQEQPHFLEQYSDFTAPISQ